MPSAKVYQMAAKDLATKPWCSLSFSAGKVIVNGRRKFYKAYLISGSEIILKNKINQGSLNKVDNRTQTRRC